MNTRSLSSKYVRWRSMPGLRTLLMVLTGSVALIVTCSSIAVAGAPPLRVCADPQNLPFSNVRGQGFENEIAALVARSLARPLRYVWRRQDADFVRSTLDAGICDVVIGLPSPSAAVETTRPYYWSSYVLIARADRHLDIVSLDDHRMRALRVGVEAIAGDRLFTPPARRLAEEGLARNLIPYTGSGALANGSKHLSGNQPGDLAARARAARSQLVQAVADGQIDLAAVWGPAIGYWAMHSRVPLRITPIGDNSEFSSRKPHFGMQAMQYQISMAVRRGDDPLRSALDLAIQQNKMQIEAVLQRFGIPLIDPSRLGRAAREQARVPAAPPAAPRIAAPTQRQGV